MARQTLVSRSGRVGTGLQPGPFTAPIVLYISNIVFFGAFFRLSSLSSCFFLANVCSKFRYRGAFPFSSSTFVEDPMMILSAHC